MSVSFHLLILGRQFCSEQEGNHSKLKELRVNSSISCLRFLIDRSTLGASDFWRRIIVTLARSEVRTKSTKKSFIPPRQAFIVKKLPSVGQKKVS